jgi:ribosome-associated protein
MEFELMGREYIQLNQLLKNLSLVGTGGEAKIRITEGEVSVNGQEELQIRKKLRAGDVVEYNGEKINIMS